MAAQLRDVLEAYTAYRPDIGYVQGMSYLAAILLLNMDTYECFQWYLLFVVCACNSVCVAIIFILLCNVLTINIVVIVCRIF